MEEIKIYVAVDEDGTENMSNDILVRETTIVGNEGYWTTLQSNSGLITLPVGTIRKLIGRDLTWEDEPVELTEEEEE